MNNTRTVLSITVVNRVIDLWLANRHMATFDMDVIEYCNSLGWDILVTQEGIDYRAMPCNYKFGDMTSCVWTISESQLTFFLLSL